MILALIWHISRAICKIEGVRERQRRKAKITVGFDYLPPEVEMISKTWLLRVAEGILMILLLGLFKLYWKCLQSVRQYNSVYLRKFHAMLDEFLNEWSGKVHFANWSVKVTHLGCRFQSAGMLSSSCESNNVSSVPINSGYCLHWVSPARIPYVSTSKFLCRANLAFIAISVSSLTTSHKSWHLTARFTRTPPVYKGLPL